MMTTFKQFLESSEDGLDLLRYELFFRKEMHLSKAAAKAAVVWAKLSGQMNAPTPTSIPEDGWDHILDWADNLYRAEKGKSIFDIFVGNRTGLTLETVVKALIARTMREKYDIELMDAPIKESVDDLQDFHFEMALRKEYGMSKEQAKECLLWLKDEKDWEDLDFDARDVFIEKWDPSTVDKHPGLSYSDHVMDEIGYALKKYNLDLRDL